MGPPSNLVTQNYIHHHSSHYGAGATSPIQETEENEYTSSQEDEEHVQKDNSFESKEDEQFNANEDNY
jgi:hypothetical protein